MGKDSTLTFGMLRGMLARDCMEELERIVNRNLDKDEYFILIRAVPDPLSPTMIRTRFVLLAEKPVVDDAGSGLLGTMLYHVNNRRGELRRLWCAPADTPQIASIRDDNNHPAAEELARSVGRTPLLH